jgi:PAS domain S-box-containing protein
VIGAVITRERTQASLQKSEERFRAVSETAQDAVIMLDEAGTVLYWNRSAQRILGHTVDEAIGRSVQE